jgi:hypothetical protein
VQVSKRVSRKVVQQKSTCERPARRPRGPGGHRPIWCVGFPRISSRSGPPQTLQPVCRHALLFGCDLGCFRIARRSGPVLDL